MIKSFEIGKGNNNTKDQTLEDVRSLFKDEEDYGKKLFLILMFEKMRRSYFILDRVDKTNHSCQKPLLI